MGEYEVPVVKNKTNGLFDGEDSDDEDAEDGKLWNISEDEDDEDEDAEDDNVKIKKAVNSKKRPLDDKNGSGSPNNKKKRKLNKQQNVDKDKLKEELTEIITKILKKYPDGLALATIWQKIQSTLSYDRAVIVSVMGTVIKEICGRNTTEITTKDGEKKAVGKYYLKKK